ncbi:PqqD family protein [Granulicella sp. L46]|jgi:hypothetical protein|uniref:PqqD family protein n=1 Tax=Granulicella sp. L46 TaxID=1641865 RepID=UPI00131BFF64|nr:PqqD family protein [Granulicella sp. L46]
MVNERTPLRTVINEDGAAVLDMPSGTITTLNPTGAYIWQALQRGETAETIAANLARETNEILEVVERGVAAFLAELKEHRLLAH